MRNAGFQIFGIDHDHNRHQPKVALVSLDLTCEQSQKVALEMIEQIRPFSIHQGLPCGTCSRARERALPQHLREGHRAPPPLRSVEHLMGLPTLSGADLIKVQAANVLYRFAVRVLRLCFLFNIKASIENPSRSWLWGILMKLILEVGDEDFTRWYSNLVATDFHACMHGGDRDKRNVLAC